MTPTRLAPPTDPAADHLQIAALLWLLVRCAEGDHSACTRRAAIDHLERIARSPDLDPTLRNTAAGLAVRWADPDPAAARCAVH